MRAREGIAVLLAATILSSPACGPRTRAILVGSTVAGVVGGAVGYTVVHHGRDGRYEVPNTIITSGVFALVTAGAMAYHFRSLDQQKVALSSALSQSYLASEIDEGPFAGRGDGKETVVARLRSTVQSIVLVETTRWVFPTFRKRYLLPERSQDELLSSRFLWEIVRPGFFATREQNPEFFAEEPELNPSVPI